jgi:hypothetical protein
MARALILAAALLCVAAYGPLAPSLFPGLSREYPNGGMPQPRARAPVEPRQLAPYYRYQHPTLYSTHAPQGVEAPARRAEAVAFPLPPDAARKFPGETLRFWDEMEELDVNNRWKPELGFGGANWEFQSYQNNRSSLYVREGVMYLQPRLVDTLSPQLLQWGATLDLWGVDPASMCTQPAHYGCIRSSPPLLPPIMSTRIRTAEHFAFKFGRVEVEAKLPRGDWIWPAIWLLPKSARYGAWPASGEIDIMEARGNAQYPNPPGGSSSFTSTFHAGAYSAVNQWPGMTRTYTQWAPAADLAADFHTYGLRWTPEFMETYIDTPSNVVLRVPFNVPGGFASRAPLSPGQHYPWQRVGKNVLAAAPFDAEFYLILNVAVGGTLGFFPDGVGGKPWSDSAGQQGAMQAFWDARGSWLPTWGDAGGDSAALKVRAVHVWQDTAFLESGVATASGDWLARSAVA